MKIIIKNRDTADSKEFEMKIKSSYSYICGGVMVFYYRGTTNHMNENKQNEL